MILLTPELREQLLANGRQRDADHIPVVKFFNPLGEGVWLATELDDDGDTLLGLAEMIAVRLPLGLGIERDIVLEGLVPISVWAEAAHRTGSIRDAERVLHAWRLSQEVWHLRGELPHESGFCRSVARVHRR